MARAPALTLSSDTLGAQQFQLFHPMGGVSAIPLPARIENLREALPCELLAFTVILYSPASFKTPVIIPFRASSFKPLGRLATEKVMGASPDAAIRKRTGEPGRTPNILAPLRRGFFDSFGVNKWGKIIECLTVRPVCLSRNTISTRFRASDSLATGMDNF